MNRRIKTNIAAYMHRVGYLLRKGAKNIQILREPSQTTTLSRVVEERKSLIDFQSNLTETFDNDRIGADEEREVEMEEATGAKLYQDRDYFLSSSMMEGILSAEGYLRKGVEIGVLEKARIYSLYGVWTPTKQEFLRPFSRAVLEMNLGRRSELKQTINAIDLGCGTGILSLILAKIGCSNIWALDKLEAAIEATELNAEVLGELERIKTVEADLIELFFDENSPSLLQKRASFFKENLMPQQFDVIVSNPPWIPASYIQAESSLENAIYDPQSRFLYSVLNFSKKHLSREGKLILVYSDLATKLGLHQDDFIEKACRTRGLEVVSREKQVPLEIKGDSKKSHKDALKNFKRESSVIVFEIAQN